jgi:hypothetical protein
MPISVTPLALANWRRNGLRNALQAHVWWVQGRRVCCTVQDPVRYRQNAPARASAAFFDWPRRQLPQYACGAPSQMKSSYGFWAMRS